MNNLNEKIQKRFKDNIAISNLKEEFLMKKNIKKQVITLSIIGIVFLSGSIITVNAATDGELVEKVKDTIQVIFTDKNGNPVEIEKATNFEYDNENIEKYEIKEDGVEYEIEVDKSVLENYNSKITVDIDENSEQIDLKIENNN